MLGDRRIQLVRTALTAAVLVAGGVTIYLNRGELAALTQLSAFALLGLTASLGAFFLTTGYTFCLLVSMLSVRLSAREWIGLTFLTNAINYLGPIRPGVVAKAAYLKRKGMAYSRFSSILAANGFLVLLYSGLAGLLLLLYGWLTRGIGSLPLVAVCMALIVVALMPFLVPLFRLEREGRFRMLVNNAVQGFREIRSQRGKMAAVGATVVLQYLLSACSCIISYRSLGFEMDLVTALALGVLLSVSNLVTITPNNLGVQEMVMAYFYAMTGMDFTNGLLGAGLIRAVHILLTFGLAPILTYWLMSSAHLRLSALVSARDPAREEPQA